MSTKRERELLQRLSDAWSWWMTGPDGDEGLDDVIDLIGEIRERFDLQTPDYSEEAE